MKDEKNEATSETENLNMATVSQKEGYSVKTRRVSDMQRTLTWRKWRDPVLSFQNNVMSWYLQWKGR